MSETRRFAGVEGLVIEAVEWLPSGADAGLLRVRGRWADGAPARPELPGLRIRSGAGVRPFESLPDARFARDPSVWRGTYLVPPELMQPGAGLLSLAWAGGEETPLPAPGEAGSRFGDPGRAAPPAGAEPAGAEPAGRRFADGGRSGSVLGSAGGADMPAAAAVPHRGGDVIDRAVLAERRARRAEAAERSQARRADEALKAVEALELRSAELERRLEALQAAGRAREAEPGGEAAQAALTAALASLAQLRTAAHDQRLRLRTSELQRSADAVALAALRSDPASAARLREALLERQGELDAALERAASAEAAVGEARRQAGEQVDAARKRAAADAAAVRERARGDLEAARDEAESARAEAGSARRRLAATAEELAAERAAHAEAREHLTAREAELQAIAVELTAAREELEHARSDAAARAGELEQRLAALDETLTTERDGRLAVATALATARARLAVAEAGHRAESVARAALDEQLDRERTAREALAAALDRAYAERAAQDASEQPRGSDGAPAAERSASAGAAELAPRELEGRLATLESALADERAARAAAEGALAEERSARTAAEAALAEERAARTATKAALVEERTAAAAMLAEERSGRAVAEAALAEERAARAAAEAALAEERAARTAAAEAATLQARIAEIERTASDDALERRAAAQAAAAAATAAPAAEQAGRLTADLDAAAAALRARMQPPGDEPAVGTAPGESPTVLEATQSGSAPAVERTPDGVTATVVSTAPADTAPDEPTAIVEPTPAVDAPADEPSASVEVAPAVDTAPDEPTAIVTADNADPPPALSASGEVFTTARRPHDAGSGDGPRLHERVAIPRAAAAVPSRPGMPVLRGALVKMAHQEPGSAARLLLALLPALPAVVQTPLDFDLTIRGTGTYAVTLGADTSSVVRITAPRPRSLATCHIAADVATLAELVAGADKRLGRWLGPVRVRGRRQQAEALALGVRTATLSLAEAARAGAAPPPDLVFRAFAHVIDPAWTRGHRFTVAQSVTGPAATTMHVLVRDGAPVVVQRWAPPGGPDATVTMSPAAFDGLLRAEPARGGDRPVVRGDRHAVALLKAWTDRAQGLGG